MQIQFFIRVCKMRYLHSYESEDAKDTEALRRYIPTKDGHKSNTSFNTHHLVI